MQNKVRKQITTGLLCLLLTISMVSPAKATNGNSLSGVTAAMGKASYWQNATGSDGDEVWLNAEEIDELNQATMDASGTMVFDLENYSSTSNADQLKNTLSNMEVPTRDLYIDGEKIDNQAYWDALSEAVQETAYSGESHENQYAIATNITSVYGIPSDDDIGYTADDPDSEYQSDSIPVGDPFIIRQKCQRDGKIFYWGVFKDLTGWVNAEDVAICSSKDEWLDAWKVETDGTDFLVVLQNQITTELSRSCPNTSGRKLTLGTVLKLVPEDKIPTNLGERNSYNNYVVYLPVRQSDGSYTKEAALISEHYTVSVGYLPLTENNLLSVAFTRLGDRYGWGNMLDASDCSGYTRIVYSCCGVILPRNTTYQQKVPRTLLSLSGLTDAEKLQVIKQLPAGTCLYFPSHTMLLLGTEDDMPYVISATGILSDSEGDLDVQSSYSVIISPLSVRRRNGSTWLSNLDAAVLLKPFTTVSNWTVNVERTDSSPIVTVYDGGTKLNAETDYTVIYGDNNVSVVGCGAYLGVKTAEIPTFDDVPTNHTFYPAVSWAVENGITSGTDETHFSPNAVTTRGQMVTFLYRAAGSPEVEPTDQFSDVDAGSYYAKAVAWAVENGITSGTGDGTTFSPNDTCTRADAVTFLWRAYGSEDVDIESSFTDVDLSKYYGKAVLWALEMNITTGTSASTFSPGKTCTRGEIVTFLYRASKMSEGKL